MLLFLPQAYNYLISILLLNIDKYVNIENSAELIRCNLTIISIFFKFFHENVINFTILLAKIL